jgi:LmbE family N-acetylglucosaminyl deacetylase
MVVGAHADDIEISTGGTLCKYLSRGYELTYVMSTNNMSGEFSTLRPDGSRETKTLSLRQIMPIRKRECDVAAEALGTVPIHLDHPQRHYRSEDLTVIELHYGAPKPNEVPDNVPSILTAYEDAGARRRLKELILEKQPECVFTHGLADINMEHLGTSLLVTRSFREAVDEGYNGSLLHWRSGYMFLGETNNRWDTYIDYSGHVDRKMELIGMHNCQMPHWQQPDFGHRVLAYDFGAACGCEAAELFVWVRRADHRGDCRTPYGSMTFELIQHSR